MEQSNNNAQKMAEEFNDEIDQSLWAATAGDLDENAAPTLIKLISDVEKSVANVPSNSLFVKSIGQAITKLIAKCMKMHEYLTAACDNLSENIGVSVGNYQLAAKLIEEIKAGLISVQNNIKWLLSDDEVPNDSPGRKALTQIYDNIIDVLTQLITMKVSTNTLANSLLDYYVKKST